MWFRHKCLCGSKEKLYYYDGKEVCERCLLALQNSQKKKTLPEKIIKSSWNELVTPKSIEDFIGQDFIKRELITMLKAQKHHGIPVQPCLFSGSFGTGKTTLAKIFAKMIGDNTYVVAANIKDKEDFPNNKIVIVDEIHTIRDEEWLLGVMDEGKQIILGATTTVGSLSGPLRSRFVSFVLQPYNTEDLIKIVTKAAKKVDYNCPDYVAQATAQRGKQVARTTLFLFKRIYDRIVLDSKISLKKVEEWFNEMNIDSDGLDNADKAYLNCLSDSPVGIQQLVAMTGFDRITLEEVIEPYLLIRGYVKRTARGRILGNNKLVKIWN